MAIREGDALPYLRLKQKMLESDCEAVFSDGRVLPTFIYKTGGQTKFTVDLDDAFYEAAALPGFVRFTKMPVSVPISTPAVQEVDNWVAKDDPVAGSESVQIAERWNGSQLYKRNLVREQHGNLVVEKFIGVDQQNPHMRYYLCRCKCHKREVRASQADLLMSRVTSCRNEKPIPSTVSDARIRNTAGLF
jgi:hypothetical protein